MIKRILCALLSALALALPARAEDPPALDLAPLVPPKAPWLRRNQKAAKKKKAPSASPPAAALPLPPLIPLTPAPVNAVSSVGVVLQNDGLDAASAARVEDGLRGVVKVAPFLRLGPVLARPAKPCADAACLSSQAAVQSIDQLLVATYAAGGLRVRLIEVASRKILAEAAQATVARDPQQATAWAEALACKILVPAGCSGEVSVDSAGSVQLELDGKPLPRGEKRKVTVGVHQLTARVGTNLARRALPVSLEGALALAAREVNGAPQLLAAGEQPVTQPPRAQPIPEQALAETPTPAAPRRWTRPVGLAALGVGAAMAVAGTYFGVKSHSDLNQAESSFRLNGGAYRKSDLAALNSGNSAAHSANALFLASGLLLVTGALITWAF